MSQSVREITQEILRREGGYINDPDDPGGATNHGVTIHTMRRLNIDLDGDGDVDADDVRRLPVARAAKIYERDYFAKPRINLLPTALHATVFDMSVNAGQTRAIKLLQALLGQFGEAVTVDGVIGAQTTAAANRAHQSVGSYLVDAYGIARRNYYYGLADRRSKSRKYARRRDGGKGGWIRRAEAFISEKYHLSAAEHKARVSKWG